MDKSFDSSSNNGGSRDQLLKNLNKVSHKISKPTRKNAAFDNHQQQMRPPPPLLPPPQHQPPVYNINMSDFRDVVQKLTGSQSHTQESFSSPQPIQPPKQPSSRLQRIRPPPLPQITSRPSPLMNNVVLPPHPQPIGGGFLTNFRPPPSLAPPLSPLPPFPPVYTAAESPISAYIRCFLQDSVSNNQGISSLAPLISPKWNTANTNATTDNIGSDPQPNVSAPPPVPSPPSMFIPPFSPLPFGCLSPMSPYSVYSPGQLGFPQFPPSFT